MQTRSDNSQFAVEALETRSMMSAVATADFNNSLQNADGSYTVSAILTLQKNKPTTDVFAGDTNGDGNPDILAGSGSGGPKFSSSTFLGNGDGTFGNRKTDNSHPNNHGGF
jgi:hypothetical protein